MKDIGDQLKLGNEKPKLPFQDIIHPIKTNVFVHSKHVRTAAMVDKCRLVAVQSANFSDKRLGSDK